MSKKKKQRFEFCVGTSNSNRSTVWKIVVDKSDVYIMSKAYGRSAKVSLHQSGVCQVAMTSEKIAELHKRSAQGNVGITRLRIMPQTTYLQLIY